MSTGDIKNLPKYASGKVAKEVLGVCDNTLRKWADSGRIATIRNSERGKRFYDIKSFCRLQNLSESENSVVHTNPKRTICYCRVSTPNQKDDLKRQVEAIRSKFPDATIIQDIGSGINWKRKGLISLIQKVKDGEVERVVIEHRDRLCRFAYELLEEIFKLYSVEIVVLNQTTEEPNKELCEDILSIIHVFSCKAMGKRRYKKQKDNAINQSKTDSIENTESSSK